MKPIFINIKPSQLYRLISLIQELSKSLRTEILTQVFIQLSDIKTGNL